MNAQKTFRQILNDAAPAAAERVWERAVVLSQLRRACRARGDRRAARRLGHQKARCLARAAAILPQEVRVAIDSDYQIGMLSIRWRGHGRLHLPLQTVSLFNE